MLGIRPRIATPGKRTTEEDWGHGVLRCAFQLYRYRDAGGEVHHGSRAGWWYADSGWPPQPWRYAHDCNRYWWAPRPLPPRNPGHCWKRFSENLGPWLKQHSKGSY